MKKMKKFLSVLLTLVMVLAMAAPSFAESGTQTQDGKITIDDAIVGQTYTIYRILELESYNTDSKAYSYKASTDWSGFINRNDIKNTYVTVDSQGYVKWVEGADVVAFAKAALDYAKKNDVWKGTPITATAENEGDKTTTIEFTNLALGYYLVDSTTGALCSLDTTNKEVTMHEKNEAPTFEKTVEEESKTGDDKYGESNTASVGQVVNFKGTITVKAGAENYVMHDKMTGMDFVEITGVTLNGNPVAAANYSLEKDNLKDECAFEVTFNQDYLNTLKKDDKIVVSYSARINSSAVVGANQNEAWLSYGNGNETTHDTTKTYTWDVDVFKYTERTQNNEIVEVALSGAKFSLYTTDGTNDTLIKLKSITVNAGETPKYQVDPVGTVTEIETDASGKFTVIGMNAGDYKLREVSAPHGYNVLKEDVNFTINEDGTTTWNGRIATEVKVLNNTGAELPSTGGIGTTIFYAAGIILMAGAVFFVVRRKRA